MTRDEVLTMKPGRELDVLVAEKVMNWKYFPVQVTDTFVRLDYFFDPVSGEARHLWNPSTDNAVALEVAIHLQKQGYYVCIELKACEETSVGVYEENPAEQIAYAKAQTPAEAICKAALLAVIDNEAN